MATNKPVGDNARKGAVKKRSQLATKTMGKKPSRNETRKAASSWPRRRRPNSRASARRGNAVYFQVGD